MVILAKLVSLPKIHFPSIRWRIWKHVFCRIIVRIHHTYVFSKDDHISIHTPILHAFLKCDWHTPTKSWGLYSLSDSGPNQVLWSIDMAGVMLCGFQGLVIKMIQRPPVLFLGYLPLELSYHAVRKHRLTHMERSTWRADTAPSRQSSPNTRHQWRSFLTIQAPSLWIFHRQLQRAEPSCSYCVPSKFLTTVSVSMTHYCSVPLNLGVICYASIVTRTDCDTM